MSVPGPDTEEVVRGGPRNRGIYLLPNAFTTASLFCGFFAIVQATHDRFAEASIAIFVAMVLDTLDGRVARMTNTQSTFGEQYDSLSDMVSFGVAPALVMYEWSLHGLGKWGWLAAFVYVAGAALRLARFNANLGKVDKRFFQGLPSPSAAALMAGLVWVATDLRETRWIDAAGVDLAWLSFIVALFGGITMVSNVPFYSFKEINLRRAVPFITMIVLVLLIVLISSDPPTVLFLGFLSYSISGYVVWIVRRRSGDRSGFLDEDPSAIAEALTGDDADAAQDSSASAKRLPDRET